MEAIREKVALITLGCPKNEVDSGVLAGELIRGGMQLVGDTQDADVILINTCGFIEDAKKESIDVILNAVRLKKEKPGIRVFVWGCLSERYRGEIEKEIPEVDGYFGVEPYKQMGRILLGSDYRWNERAFKDRILTTPGHTAYLKIADGCDHRCTFCAIPMIKGSFRSRPLQELFYEAEALSERGVKELILIAQDTTQYGKDLNGKVNLVSLIQKLMNLKSIQWIRIMYTHPLYITDELIDLIGGENQICSYLDMPLQHISNPILKAMGRGQTKESIENLIEKMRARIPDLILRTAFIVGFPGETDSHFDELVEFVKRMCFERMGVFVFSPEQDTKAFEYETDVTGEVASHRFTELMQVQADISNQMNQSALSTTVPVLIDGYDESRKEYFGRTEGDCLEIDQLVWVKGEAVSGQIVSVTIEEASTYDLRGRVVPGSHLRR